jgi:hypothetical protein
MVDFSGLHEYHADQWSGGNFILCIINDDNQEVRPEKEG